MTNENDGLDQPGAGEGRGIMDGVFVLAEQPEATDEPVIVRPARVDGSIAGIRACWILGSLVLVAVLAFAGPLMMKNAGQVKETMSQAAERDSLSAKLETAQSEKDLLAGRAENLKLLLEERDQAMKRLQADVDEERGKSKELEALLRKQQEIATEAHSHARIAQEEQARLSSEFEAGLALARRESLAVAGPHRAAVLALAFETLDFKEYLGAVVESDLGPLEEDSLRTEFVPALKAYATKMGRKMPSELESDPEKVISKKGVVRYPDVYDKLKEEWKKQ